MIRMAQSVASNNLRVGSALRQAVTFAFVGGLATLTHFTVALLLNSQMGLAPLQANLCGYISSVLISYVGNARLTFKSRIFHARQFMRFSVVSLAGLALGQGLMHLGVSVVHAPFVLALLAVVSIVPVFTFVASRVWTFTLNTDAHESLAARTTDAMPSHSEIAANSPHDWKVTAAIVAIFVAAIVPVIAAPILPMVDYYSHVARYFVLANLNSDAFLGQFYEARWAILPNIGLDVIGVSLMKILPPLSVAKLLVLMIFAVQYFGLIAFNRQITGSISPVTALLATPLLYSFILGWGFANFLLALGFVFWGAAWWLAQRHRPWRAIPVACAISVLIFLTHGVAFALYGILLGGLELGRFFGARPRSLRTLLTSMSALAVQAVAPLFLFLASPTSSSLNGVSNADESIRKLAHDGQLAHRLQELAAYRLTTIYRVSESPSLALDLVSFGMIAGIIAVLLFHRRLKLPLLAVPALLIAAVLVAFVPPALFGVGYIADRMPLFMAFILVGSLVPRLQGGAIERVCITLLVAVVGLKLVWTGVAWQANRQDLADFEAVAANIPPHSLVAYANIANQHRLETESRCQMYGPIVMPLRAAASPLFAYRSQQPIALRGRLEQANRALSISDGPNGVIGVQRRLDTMVRLHQFDFVLVCRPEQREAFPLPDAPIAEQGRFALIRLQK